MALQLLMLGVIATCAWSYVYERRIVDRSRNELQKHEEQERVNTVFCEMTKLLEIDPY